MHDAPHRWGLLPSVFKASLLSLNLLPLGVWVGAGSELSSVLLARDGNVYKLSIGKG